MAKATMIWRVARLLLLRNLRCTIGHPTAPRMPKTGVLQQDPRYSLDVVDPSMQLGWRRCRSYRTPTRTRDEAGIPSVPFAKRMAVDVMVANASDMMNHARRYLKVSGSWR